MVIFVIVSGSDTNATAVYLVKRFVENPSYSTTTNLNDIGLVETINTIVWSRVVAPVCLPFLYTAADFAGQIVTATGWGSTSFGGPSSNVLLKVNLNVLTNTQCATSYPNIAASQMWVYFLIFFINRTKYKRTLIKNSIFFRCTYTSQKDTCQVSRHFLLNTVSNNSVSSMTQAGHYSIVEVLIPGCS